MSPDTGTDSKRGLFRASEKRPDDRYASPFEMLVGGALFLVVAALLISALVNLWPVVDTQPAVVAPATKTAPKTTPNIRPKTGPTTGRKKHRKTAPKSSSKAAHTAAQTIVPASSTAQAQAQAAVQAATQANTQRPVRLAWGAFTMSVNRSAALLVLAALLGAIGGFLQAATSFSTFIGNRQFKASWIWWYSLRIPIGGLLALLVYVALRAGFLATSGATGATQIDAYGVAAVSGLTGLFSKQATDKLKEIFETAFRTGGDAARGDKLLAGKPMISKLTPDSVSAGAAATLIVTGCNFSDESKLLFDCVAQATKFRSANELATDIAGTQFAAAGSVKVSVLNPDGTISESHPLTIT